MGNDVEKAAFVDFHPIHKVRGMEEGNHLFVYAVGELTYADY
jgi:hypothetical protein